jgi:hypothetical protein
MYILALIVIAEHSYFLWDRERANNPGYFTTAMTLYKDSPSSGTVIRAVKEAFEGDQRGSFGLLRTEARKDARKTLTKRMLKIAMDNRLCSSDFRSIRGQSDLFFLITAKDSLAEQVETARSANKKDWTDDLV